MKPRTPLPWSLGGTFMPHSDNPRTVIYGPRAEPHHQSGPAVARDISVADGEFAVRACNAFGPLTELAEAIRSIRDDQTSDAIFGGQTTDQRRRASDTYASRIRDQAGKIDDLLERVETEMSR